MQSGTGLGFKLTPAYLLQMCVSYCALHLGTLSRVSVVTDYEGGSALRRLLGKIATQINGVVAVRHSIFS